jgi:hypothetical protein
MLSVKSPSLIICLTYTAEACWGLHPTAAVEALPRRLQTSKFTDQVLTAACSYYFSRHVNAAEKYIISSHFLKELMAQ